MKDTKSSEIRNKNRGHVASPFSKNKEGMNLFSQFEKNMTQGGSKAAIHNSGQRSPGKKSPSKMHGRMSPTSKSKALAKAQASLQSIINLKSTPTKFDEIKELKKEDSEQSLHVKKEAAITYYADIKSPTDVHVNIKTEK